MSFLSPLYAIDLGSQTTRVYGADSDVMVTFPTQENKKGKSGKYPMVSRGRITDEVQMGKYLQSKLAGQLWAFGIAKPRMAAAVACCQSQVEKIAMAQALSVAGASSIRLVSASLAAACGAGVDLTSDRASVFLSCGQSASEMAVILSGSQIYSQELNLTIDGLCEFIRMRLEQEMAIQIQSYPISKLLAQTSPLSDPKKEYSLPGKKLSEGKMAEYAVPGSLISGITQEYISTQASIIKSCLQHMSATFASDLVNQGMILYGGLGAMKGLPLFLSGELSIPVSCVPDPESVVINGLKEIAASISYEELEEDPMHIQVLGC